MHAHCNHDSHVVDHGVGLAGPASAIARELAIVSGGPPLLGGDLGKPLREVPAHPLRPVIVRDERGLQGEPALGRRLLDELGDVDEAVSRSVKQAEELQ